MTTPQDLLNTLEAKMDEVLDQAGETLKEAASGVMASLGLTEAMAEADDAEEIDAADMDDEDADDEDADDEDMDDEDMDSDAETSDEAVEASEEAPAV